MKKSQIEITVRQAGVIAGAAILVTVMTAPFAELYVYPSLIIPYKSAETAKNIIDHQSMFIAALFGYVLTFICDVVITWGLYILLKPVNKHLSLLTAMFRLIYTIVAIVSLQNLVTAFRLLVVPEYLQMYEIDQLQAQAMLYLRAFKNHWYFGIIFFGIHLCLLGYMVFRSTYIPKILGVILVITGLGYLLTTLRPYFFPDVNVDFASYTFYGELIFMLWLLIKSNKIKYLPDAHD